ncbi:MAG TPA: hypothetical protein H9955_00525 [Candidatus Mediterraneibacter cottocaccae]|nr:hypothetical protein [Candidatus Mediterraneibacter cottocaccae]
MKIIYVNTRDNDCVTRNGEVAEENERIVYKNSDGKEMISIEKEYNQFKITIDERYVDELNPIP